MKYTLSNRLLLISFLVFLSTSIFAQQQFEIKGRIVKSEKRSKNIAKILLLDSNTLEVICSTYSNSDGEFIFENIEQGEYLLMAKKPGISLIETKHISITDKISVVRNFREPEGSKEVKLVATNQNELKNF